MLDQLLGYIADDTEAVVLIDLGQDGAQTSFQIVGAGGRVDNQGVLWVAPRVVDHRDRHQGGNEFLIGKVGLFRKRNIGVPGVLSGEQGAEHRELPDVSPEEDAEADEQSNCFDVVGLRTVMTGAKLVYSGLEAFWGQCEPK